MRRTNRAVLAACLVWAAATASATAQEPGQERVAEIERRVDVLTREIERLKLGEAAEEPELDSVLGFGPAASKVYKKAAKRVSIGGYGEMVYTTYRNSDQKGDASGKTDTVDFVRAILYVGYKFNDWITFNSETEFEHATEAKRGEVGVEMAALDLKPWGFLGFRAGLLLMPVGLINEIHEPTTFHGANRPNVEKNIYPSTWRDNGAGIFGEIGPVSYRSYVVAGLQAVEDSDSKVDGFKHSSGLRNGRSKGSKSFANDFAVVTRVDVEPVEGVLLGGSVYTGEADHEMAPTVPVTFWDLHAKGQWRGFEGRAMYVQGHIGNVDTLNAAQGIGAGSSESIGSDLFGGYIEGAFDVLSLHPANNGHYLAPFFRYERYDTQLTVPDGWTKKPANSRVEYAFGLTYKPIPHVVVKLDHQIMRNQARTGVNRTNMAVGYIF